MSETNSVISIDKTKSSIGSYLWNSPCLKPLFYNPFFLCSLILLVIWAMDIVYGKNFAKESRCPSIYIQHILTSYFLVAGCICLNNMLLRYRCKLDKYEKKEEDQKSDSPAVEGGITSEYVDDQVSTY